MKILAGQWRGRPIAAPPARTTRPLSEKVRAAIFDVVGSPEGLVVLDAYSGSGAAGLEALSRGALLVEALERDARACRIIAGSAHELGADATYVLHQVSVETWLAAPGQAAPGQAAPAPRYGLIIADPPYARLEPDIIGRLVAFLATNGVLVLSHSSRISAPELPGATLAKTKHYGDTALAFYTR